ncbi:hypothetical protein GCM10009605_43240 [Nocardiopsis composta]
MVLPARTSRRFGATEAALPPQHAKASDAVGGRAIPACSGHAPARLRGSDPPGVHDTSTEGTGDGMALRDRTTEENPS